LLSELAVSVAPERHDAATAVGGTAPQSLAEQVAQAPEGRRRALVAAFVREKALRSLGVDPSRAIDPRTPLGDLGLDSLLAVELRNTLGRALGRTLPATLLFDHPSLDALTDFLLAELQPAAAAPALAAPEPPAPEPTASLVDSIEDLSDEEVERLLAARAKKG